MAETENKEQLPVKQTIFADPGAAKARRFKAIFRPDGMPKKPKKYETPELLAEAVCDYFIYIIDAETMPTMTGLALYLGFADRQSLLDYKGYSDEFKHVFNKAKLTIESFLENELIRNPGQVAGLIFNLKNNFGWVDRRDHTTGGDKLPAGPAAMIIFSNEDDENVQDQTDTEADEGMEVTG